MTATSGVAPPIEQLGQSTTPTRHEPRRLRVGVPVTAAAPHQSGVRYSVGELLLFAVGYAIYAIIRNYVGLVDNVDDVRRATSNSLRIIKLERWCGIFQEGHWQRAVLESPWLTRVLDSFWAYSYLVVTAAMIGWLIKRHPASYASLRNGFVLATAAALLIFALYPTVPPRLLSPSYGIIDTWVRWGGIAASKAPRVEQISDPFASMPSLHVAWSAWTAVAVSTVVRRWLPRIVIWAYFLLTVFAVVVTGNHFVLDCVAGIALMLVSLRVVPASRDRVPGSARNRGLKDGTVPRCGVTARISRVNPGQTKVSVRRGGVIGWRRFASRGCAKL